MRLRETSSVDLCSPHTVYLCAYASIHTQTHTSAQAHPLTQYDTKTAKMLLSLRDFCKFIPKAANIQLAQLNMKPNNRILP